MSKEFGRIDKNTHEEIRFTLVDCGAQGQVDIRVWKKANPAEGHEGLPTNKGLRFNAELLPEVISVLQGMDKALAGPGSLG